MAKDETVASFKLKQSPSKIDVLYATHRSQNRIKSSVSTLLRKLNASSQNMPDISPE
jgi:hypothetical protein